jgi:hypothetical protein
MTKTVKSRQISNVGGKSAYHPRLSVNAEHPRCRPSATTGREQMQQILSLFNYFVGKRE